MFIWAPIAAHASGGAHINITYNYNINLQSKQKTLQELSWYFFHFLQVGFTCFLLVLTNQTSICDTFTGDSGDRTRTIHLKTVNYLLNTVLVDWSRWDKKG